MIYTLLRHSNRKSHFVSFLMCKINFATYPKKSMLKYPTREQQFEVNHMVKEQAHMVKQDERPPEIFS